MNEENEYQGNKKFAVSDGTTPFYGTLEKQYRGMCPGGSMLHHYNFEKVHKLGPWARKEVA